MILEDKRLREEVMGEAQGAMADALRGYEDHIAKYLEVLVGLAKCNPVMEVEGTTICALCDTSEHYRHWPRHKDHCPWQQARDMTEEWR